MDNRQTSGVFTKTYMDESTKLLHVVAGELAPDDFDKSGTFMNFCISYSRKVAIPRLTPK